MQGAYWITFWLLPAGVLQVTWQRFVKGTVEDMATYSERFGIEVKTPYRGKVLVTKESFSPSAIKLTNLTWEDESCLSCAFNTFPGGSKRSQICLKVQGRLLQTHSYERTL